MIRITPHFSFLDPSQSRYARRIGKGFTLIELLTVIAVIAVLAGILFPVIQSGITSSRKSKCASNLRQIYTGMAMYANEHNGLILPALGGAAADYAVWVDKLIDYIDVDLRFPNGEEPRSVLACPESDAVSVGGARSHYGQSTRINQAYTQENDDGSFQKAGGMVYMQTVDRPSQTLYLADAKNPDGLNSCVRNISPYNMDTIAFRHNDQANLLFLDGHVESWTRDQFPEEGRTASRSVPWSVKEDL